MTAACSLYIHFPWCVRKCPYCDFNSHKKTGKLPEDDYISALLADLDTDLANIQLLAKQHEISSVFLGGGTPSLFSAHGIKRLLDQIKHRLNLYADIEITMEVNPGSISVPDSGNLSDASLISTSGNTEFLAEEKLAGFNYAGVNRLSLGVQSLNETHLRSLGRIHSAESATNTYQLARSAGFRNINIDLMHGLPDQSLEEAMADLQKVIELQPEHISWYQLTIEPNTIFYNHPPQLPDEDSLWQIYETGLSLLAENGFSRYEVSAFARPGYQSRHNLNYWSFGDYLGIGAGAHGKQRLAEGLVRTTKTRLPEDYLVSPNTKHNRIPDDDLLLEYLMNTMRLIDGFTYQQFEERTGVSREALLPFTRRAGEKSLITVKDDGVKPTSQGLQYLNELLLLV